MYRDGGPHVTYSKRIHGVRALGVGCIGWDAILIRWQDNKFATAVDEQYLADTNAPMGVYRLGYYPHNVHFVLASAQMAGNGTTVIAAAEKLRGLIPDEVARDIAMVHPVKAAPYFAHAKFSAPETILALPDPGEAIPYVKAIAAGCRASHSS